MRRRAFKKSSFNDNKVTPFGWFCRDMRHRYDETVQDMAKSLGTSRTYLNQVELGYSAVPPYFISRFNEQYCMYEGDRERLLKAVNETNKDIKQLCFAHIPDDLRVRILGVAYEMILKEGGVKDEKEQENA